MWWGAQSSCVPMELCTDELGHRDGLLGHQALGTTTDGRSGRLAKLGELRWVSGVCWELGSSPCVERDGSGWSLDPRGGH